MYIYRLRLTAPLSILAHRSREHFRKRHLKMYIYTYTYVCTYMYTHTYKYIHTYICTYVTCFLLRLSSFLRTDPGKISTRGTSILMWISPDTTKQISPTFSVCSSACCSACCSVCCSVCCSSRMPSAEY